jgi:uncharacterized protein involved in exopolysaccharide biosynthesis
MGTETESTEVEEVEGEDTESGNPDKVDRLEGKVDSLAEMVKKLLSGGKPTQAKADEVSAVGQQVKDEVAKLQAEEKKQGRETAASKRLDALEAKIAGLEKTPVEYRKITTFFWGSE